MDNFGTKNVNQNFFFTKTKMIDQQFLYLPSFFFVLSVFTCSFAYDFFSKVIENFLLQFFLTEIFLN